MAQDIVGGLFGIQQQPDYSTQDYRTAIAMAEMNTPQQMGRFLGGMVGAPLGRAAAQGVGSLLGVQDPRLQQASVIREAQQQGFDVTTPEGLQSLAQFFVQRGQPGLASQVAQQAQGMLAEQTKINRAEDEFRREQMFREEASQLGQDATEADIMRLALKYGKPDTAVSAMAGIQRAREASDVRIQMAQEKEFTKAQEKKEKQLAANQSALAAIMPVMDTIEKSIPLVGMSTAGVGSYLSYLPNTDARTLKANIDTIKANLGFQQLQAMRQASPTGGALGQVAVKELEALQSTIASLDPAQSPDVLKGNLKKVRDHYIKWKDTLEKSIGEAPSSNIPAKEQWMAAARNAPQNRGVSEAELNAYYDKTYGGR